MEVPAALRRTLRVLVLQVRHHESAALHEVSCYAESTGLDLERFDRHNLPDDPRIPADRVRRADVLIIGGSGETTVTVQYPFTEPLADLVRERISRKQPLWGACWGHHFLAAVLGGRVITDLAAEEIGTYEVELTPEGRQDELFAPFPPRFRAQLGHHDRVESLGPQLVELAASERCRNQAIRVPDLPVYGTQFHSEMTEEHMRQRLRMYEESYVAGAGDVFARLRPTEEIRPLLSRFLTLYCS